MSDSTAKPVPAPPKGGGPPIRITKPEPLFRRLDWITFAFTTVIVLACYVFTLAPDLTLEDSGELAVGSYYAGVPHPPGYPVWTIYTWLFTLIPYSNIAWRVALSSAVAGAFACGLLALLVSRGSSLLLEGIPDFKNIDRKLEGAICLVSGFISGSLLGFNGFMWSQAVIVEVYTLSVLSFMAVLCCLLRWIHSPERRRYLYWAFFWFGICFTNHQTLIVAAIGIEVAILAAHPKLGRDMFIGNSLVYLMGLLAKSAGVLTSFDQNLPLFMVYNAVGISSILVSGYMISKVGKPFTEWKPVMICLMLWVLGALFYFYMPLASMTNPPLNWGYPRTKEGFIHALTRGQYDKTNPTDSVFKFFGQAAMYFEGAIDEFSLVYLLVGLIPFVFYMKMQKRERAWLMGLSSIYLLLAFLLMILLNPQTDKQSANQTRVFFTASHIILAILIGYGVTLICGMGSLLYERYRRPMLMCGAVACGIQLYFVYATFERTQFTLLRAADLLVFCGAVAFTLLMLLCRQHAPAMLLLALFSLAPIRSVLTNWSDAEQRGHIFGYWFGHDMFSPPFGVYPEMARNTVLFGGTDPGRFNPTYMIFCESFLPSKHKPKDPNFDRRDVYLITQNALADKTYLDYIRAHYNRSAHKDPYFFSELFRTDKAVELNRTNLFAKLMLPLDRFFTDLGDKMEKRRRAEGVYPPKEIITPTNEDSQIAFQDYIMDAQRRLAHDTQFPNEPRQMKPGEDVRIADGRVQVTGQVAVMALNGLLTKVIFDKNPDHEFYVEESFPLEWMFPHLTPSGIIMKINREKVGDLSEDTLTKDHEFWSKYSERFIGNWITYDTPIKDICDFAEKTYLRRDLSGFKGDPKFVRDEFAQKAFSKLRSAIGGIYAWRVHAPECPPEFRPKTPESSQRIAREAEFAFKQSFAFCPYSPEAVYKYVQLLLSMGRMPDALLIAETSLKWDTGNQALMSLVNQLKSMRPNMAQYQAQVSQLNTQLAGLEAEFRSNSTNHQLGIQLAKAYVSAGRIDAAGQVLDQVAASPDVEVSTLLSVAQNYAELGNKLKVDALLQTLQKALPKAEERFRASSNDVGLAFQIVSAYLVTQKTNEAVRFVDQLLARPDADPSTLLSAAQVYAQVQDVPKLESALRKLVAAMPTHAEAWYDLAGVQVALNKNDEALASLGKALELNSSKVAGQGNSRDLRMVAATDVRFVSLQRNPEFQKLLKGK